jgi:hypothetical protein
MAAVTMQDLQGLYKQAYPDGVEKAYADEALLTKIVPFSEDARVGDKYHVPVILTREGGVTYAASGAGMYSLKTPKALVMKDAQIDGVQITVRSQLPLDVIARSLGSGKAFKKATIPIFESNLETHSKRNEIAFLYGQSKTGIGQTQASGSANVDATHSKLRISDATWAIGVWKAEEGTDIRVYKNSDNTQVGTAEFTVTQVDPDAKTIYVLGAAADITALDVAVAAGACNLEFDLAYVTGGTHVKASANTMFGVDAHLTAISSDTVFNIPCTYTLWTGSTYAITGQLTWTEAVAGTNRAVGKGGVSGEVYMFCSIDTWPNLAEQFVSARTFDVSAKSDAELGVETIQYLGPNGTRIKVAGHPLVKGGETFILPKKALVRGGAQEPSFTTPGKSEEMFTWVQDKNGYEVRSYSDQFILVKQPAKCVKITGIVNQ